VTNTVAPAWSMAGESEMTKRYLMLHSSSMPVDEHAILEAALLGLQARREKIDRRIADLRGMLTTDGNSRDNIEEKTKSKRVISAAVRKRMAAAQRRRWREYRAEQR
jgi:hypothetical protein